MIETLIVEKLAERKAVILKPKEEKVTVGEYFRFQDNTKPLAEHFIYLGVMIYKGITV